VSVPNNNRPRDRTRHSQSPINVILIHQPNHTSLPHPAIHPPNLIPKPIQQPTNLIIEIVRIRRSGNQSRGQIIAMKACSDLLNNLRNSNRKRIKRSIAKPPYPHCDRAFLPRRKDAQGVYDIVQGDVAAGDERLPLALGPVLVEGIGELVGAVGGRGLESVFGGGGLAGGVAHCDRLGRDMFCLQGEWP